MISASNSNLSGAVLRQGGLSVSSAIHQAITSTYMTPVEQMDRNLKAWVQEYGDINPEVLPVLETLGN